MKIFKYFLIIIMLPLFLTPSYIKAQTDSTFQFKSSLDAYPYAYYTPETQLAFGGGGVYTFYMQKDSLINPSSVTFSGYCSTIKNYQLTLDSRLFFNRNRFAMELDVVYGHYVDRFYGIGNNTPDLGTEEYVLDNVGGMVDFQIPPLLFICDRSGFVWEYNNYTIVDRKQNPYLDSSYVTGHDGGTVSGVGFVFIWDTRDQIFFPNGGGFTQINSIFYSGDLGSDFTFFWLEINGRRYWSFNKDHVIGAQVYIVDTQGDPPFFKMPALGGGSIMRGYYEGRHRDKTYAATQVEYRQYFWRRFGIIAFAGIGQVAPKLTSISMNEFKPSYGFGLRFLFNKEQKINLRADVGFGKNTSGVYFGIEEAF